MQRAEPPDVYGDVSRVQSERRAWRAAAPLLLSRHAKEAYVPAAFFWNWLPPDRVLFGAYSL